MLPAAAVACSLLASAMSPSPPLDQQIADVEGFERCGIAAVRVLLDQARRTINSPKWRYAAAAAVRKLGHMRASEAVPFLVANIGFSPTEHDQFGNGLSTLEMTHPCIHALAQIGPPVYPAVLKMAEKEYREIVQTYVAVVFKESLGADYAAVYLEHYTSTLTDCTFRDLIAF